MSYLESIDWERNDKMHDENLMDKMKDGLEKAKDFAMDAKDNVTEKLKQGWDKLADIKDDAVDAIETPGESLNEQLCESLEGTDDDNKMHIQEEFCQTDYDEFDNELEPDDIVLKETYEEYKIMPDDEENAA